MRNLLRWAAILALGILAAAAACQTVQQDADAQAPPVFGTEKDKMSYAVGADIGTDLRDQPIDLTLELLLQGITDGLAGNRLHMSEQEIEATVGSFRRELRERLAAAATRLGEENKRQGREFLEANKKQHGVISLENGLQYKILEQGDGPRPGASDVVECHYRGTLIDGTEFDSSYRRGQPAVLPVRKLIAGWEQALQMMPVGSRWQLFVPPELGYGTRATEGIGPNSTLIFEIELVGIQPAGKVELRRTQPDAPARKSQREPDAASQLAGNALRVEIAQEPREPSE